MRWWITSCCWPPLPRFPRVRYRLLICKTAQKNSSRWSTRWWVITSRRWPPPPLRVWQRLEMWKTDKKKQVIDSLVDHFMSFTTETRVLPVLWHQSLLVFAQRYREDVTRADKDRLKEVRYCCLYSYLTFFVVLFLFLMLPASLMPDISVRVLGLLLALLVIIAQMVVRLSLCFFSTPRPHVGDLSYYRTDIWGCFRFLMFSRIRSIQQVVLRVVCFWREMRGIVGSSCTNGINASPVVQKRLMVRVNNAPIGRYLEAVYFCACRCVCTASVELCSTRVLVTTAAP